MLTQCDKRIEEHAEHACIFIKLHSLSNSCPFYKVHRTVLAMLSARVMTDRRNRDCGRSALESLLDIDNFYPKMEQTLISDNMSTLEPRAVCINAVGNKECSEATSETVLEFLLENLNEKSSGISKKLFNAMKNRIEESRSVSLCGLLYYINNLSSNYVCSSSSSCILTWMNKRGMKVTAKELPDRMFKIQIRININGYGNDSEKRDLDISESIADQFDTLIRKGKYFKCDAMDSCFGKDIMQIIKNEMVSFEPIATSKDNTNIIRCTYNSTNDILSS
ncbi:conserved hypothetical protein [Trichinella spiralis]|uniref:hypothetical protein n=1 Tax=Trichinella spiralis TaxID=6334 RepID=UPI0001EFC922|nr:conserved hypothetical protein [Trichinella spiralis]